MAHKRMFSKDITESDSFTDMPLSTQALYFHLGMGADDDGFINNPKKIQRSIGASADDLSLLIAKRFVIPFDSGVVVIKHWKIHNYIPNDRYHPTNYKDEYALLSIDENKAYTLTNKQYDLRLSGVDTECIQDVSKTDTEKRKEEKSIEKKRDTLSGKPDCAENVREIVSYLNSVTGSSYKPTTKKTVSLIRARFGEGFTVDDFKAVIDRKSSDWLSDAKMRRYLRPETLFGTKFEGYLNEGRVMGNGVGRYSKYR